MHVVKAIVYAVLLLCKTPALLFGFFAGRSQGARSFRRELLASGMRPEQAEQLTRMYKSMLLPHWKELPYVRLKR